MTLRGHVRLLSGRAPTGAMTSPSMRVRQRAITSPSDRPSGFCSGDRPRRSRSWAPSGSVTRRASEARVRPTSRPRPPSAYSGRLVRTTRFRFGRGGISDATRPHGSTPSCHTEFRQLPAPLPPRKRRTRSSNLQLRRRAVHDLRRDRVVRRVLHHLEHLHDDRDAALT